MNEEIASRSEWIDVAKGIGIIAVIIVHSLIPIVNAVTTHLSAFAIQLFFVVAGLTHNNKKYRSQIDRLIRVRGRQLLIPYFILYFMMIGLFIILDPFIGTDLTSEQLLYWFLYGSGPPQSSTHLWFLPVLFFGLVLFAIIDKVTANLPHGTRLIFLFILPIAASWLTTTLSPNLVPWHINAIFIATAFILFGNELRLYLDGDVGHRIPQKKSVALFIIATIGLLVFSSLNGFTDLAVDNIGVNVWLYMLAGGMGSIMCLSLAILISQSLNRLRRLLTSFGTHSQVVYEFHPLLFFLVPLILLIFGAVPDHLLVTEEWVWPLRLSLALFFSLPVVVYVIERNRILRFIFRGTTASRPR